MANQKCLNYNLLSLKMDCALLKFTEVYTGSVDIMKDSLCLYLLCYNRA